MNGTSRELLLRGTERGGGWTLRSATGRGLQSARWWLASRAWVLRSSWDWLHFACSTEYFPLTLTLSLREREQQASDWCFADGYWANSGTGVIDRRWTNLPLPRGEGRGEGEPSVAHPTVQSVCSHARLGRSHSRGINPAPLLSEKGGGPQQSNMPAPMQGLPTRAKPLGVGQPSGAYWPGPPWFVGKLNENGF